MKALPLLLLSLPATLWAIDSVATNEEPAGESLSTQERRYEVLFTPAGNEALSAREIRRALSPLRVDLERTGVTDGAADDAAYETERFYQRNGFEKVHVASSWRRVEDVFHIALTITEGPRSLVAALTFSGTDAIESTELALCFQWSREGFFEFGTEVFTQATLESGVACVLSKFQFEGYVFAQVNSNVTVDNQEGRHVTITVRQGNQILLEEQPEISGAKALPEAELKQLLHLEVPVAYTPRLPLVLRGRLIDHYRARGYLLVHVTTERNLDPNGHASLAFTVEEGPRTTIEGVRIAGNEKTRASVLERRITLRAGDLYNAERVRESTASLYRSGLFSNVELRAVPVNDAPDKAYLDATVEEKARYRISLLGGYGSYEFLRAGAVLENINVLGWGHRLRLSGSKSFRSENIIAEYTNPFFFNERLSHSVRGTHTRREHPSFQRTEFGGETDLSYRLSEHIRTSLTYRLRQSESEDVEDDVPSVLVDDVLLSSVNIAAVADYRNSALDPTRGWTGRIGLEYSSEAIGSELDFLRPSALLTFVFPLGEHVHLITSARVAAIIPFGETEEIPIQERFFLGGESSIRSFREDQAGPLQDNDAIGGEAYTNYGAELRFPIFRNLRGALFYDTGTLTERAQDFGGGRFFHAVGIGVRYRTLVGPLRVDFALNPERADDEETYVIHLGLGYPF